MWRHDCLYHTKATFYRRVPGCLGLCACVWCMCCLCAGPSLSMTLRAIPHGRWRRPGRRGCMLLLWRLHGAARCAVSRADMCTPLFSMMSFSPQHFLQAGLNNSCANIQVTFAHLSASSPDLWWLLCCRHSCSSTSTGNCTAITGWQMARETEASSSSSPTARKHQFGQV